MPSSQQKAVPRTSGRSELRSQTAEKGSGRSRWTRTRPGGLRLALPLMEIHLVRRRACVPGDRVQDCNACQALQSVAMHLRNSNRYDRGFNDAGVIAFRMEWLPADVECFRLKGKPFSADPQSRTTTPSRRAMQ